MCICRDAWPVGCLGDSFSVCFLYNPTLEWRSFFSTPLQLPQGRNPGIFQGLPQISEKPHVSKVSVPARLSRRCGSSAPGSWGRRISYKQNKTNKTRKEQSRVSALLLSTRSRFGRCSWGLSGSQWWHLMCLLSFYCEIQPALYRKVWKYAHIKNDDGCLYEENIVGMEGWWFSIFNKIDWLIDSLFVYECFLYMYVWEMSSQHPHQASHNCL